MPPVVSREDVRALIADCGVQPHVDSWLRGIDAEFSRKLASAGYVGITVPERFGGQGAGHVDRYVLTEELLMAGAPVAYHWMGDRQIAPTLLAAGNDRLAEELIPAICRGELCVCVGISEPNAGSDVAAIATSARKHGDTFVVNGQKVWTTGAMHAQYCYLVARTSKDPDNRHLGLSEFVVPMDTPGITVRPIDDLAGQAHFAEIFFDDVVVEDWRVVGTVDDGFRQIVRQLDYERSGPERFLSTVPLLTELAQLDGIDEPRLGELYARLAGLRKLALDVAKTMDAGVPPSADAALVKDLGAIYERDIVTVAQDVADAHGITDGPFADRLREGLLYQSTFALRGGTAEILRGIVAKRALQL